MITLPIRKSQVIHCAILTFTFAFILIWNIHFYYSDRLHMIGYGGNDNLAETIASWLGLIIQLWLILPLLILNLNLFSSITSTIAFGIISASIVAFGLHQLICRFKILKSACILIFPLCSVITVNLAIRDYIKYQQIAQHDHG